MNIWQRAFWDRLFLIVLLVGVIIIGGSRVQPNTATLAAASLSAVDLPSAPHVGSPAPPFALSDLNNTSTSLSALKGQVILINIWATWCPPCRAEMPTIQATYEQYRERGFVVLAVNQAEDVNTVAAFMQQFGLTFPALLDSDSMVSALYQVRVLPSSFFVDRKGIIRVVYFGPMPRSVISGTIEQLLQEER